jgi:hypothetical protein
MPVTMVNMQPLISAQINGVQARFVAATAFFYGMISPAAAARFKPPLTPAPLGLSVEGVGGTTVPEVATVKTFTSINVPIHHVRFLVGGNDDAPGAVGYLGQNLLRVADDEFDSANGVMRFVKTEHCGSKELAYWDTTKPIGVVDLEQMSAADPQLIGWGRVNGHRICVLFDPGTSRSVLSLSAARRAGISPGTPGVVADIHRSGTGADMSLGADFFLSHHVYVAYGRRWI